MISRLALALLLASPAVLAEGDLWVADFDQAAEQARKEGKDLLVDFTGSDWCGWCKKLHAEVFAHQEFVDAATKEYVLVALDFPRAEELKAKVPNPARNEELMGKYGVRGFPTILLVTPDGDVFGQTGYQQGGPAAYNESLAKMRTEGKANLARRSGLAKAFADAKGDARGSAYEAVLAEIEAMGEDVVGVAPLVGAARSGLDVDAADAKGLKTRGLKAVLSHGGGDAAVEADIATFDPKNEKGLREAVVLSHIEKIRAREEVPAVLKEIEELDALGPIRDNMTARRLYANAALWNYHIAQDKAKAKTFAQKAKDSGFDNPQFLPQLDKILAE
jgi:thioredoxin-related protein